MNRKKKRMGGKEGRRKERRKQGRKGRRDREGGKEISSVLQG